MGHAVRSRSDSDAGRRLVSGDRRLSRDRKVVFWDFHGTLAEEPGGWAGTLIETLDRYSSGHRINSEDLRPHLRDGFPWHRPEKPHPELSSSELWWESVHPVFGRAFESVGIQPSKAREMARKVRLVYTRPERYRLYGDSIAALESLRSAGWDHVILSNHVPELTEIVESIGLSEQFQAVVNSAITGYEKPHRRAFEAALEAAGKPASAWMVGDNPVADVLGAEEAGIPAILVRRQDPRCRRAAPDLIAAAEIIRRS